MSEEETLDRRLRAVERALTDGDEGRPQLADADEVLDRIATLEDQVGTLEEQVTELDAATQALRGYVGNVRAVNEDVERRADAALAAVERLEERASDGSELDTPSTDPDPSGQQNPEASPVDHSADGPQTLESHRARNDVEATRRLAADGQTPTNLDSRASQDQTVPGDHRPESRCSACGRPPADASEETVDGPPTTESVPGGSQGGVSTDSGSKPDHESLLERVRNVV